MEIYILERSNGPLPDDPAIPRSYEVNSLPEMFVFDMHDAEPPLKKRLFVHDRHKNLMCEAEIFKFLFIG